MAELAQFESNLEDRETARGAQSHLDYRVWGKLLQQTWDAASDHQIGRLGAALAYYAVFSLAPLLVIIVGVVGLVWGDVAAQGQLHAQLDEFMGNQGAAAIEELVAHARRPSSSLTATIVGFVVLVVAASGVLAELKEALNTIWEVKQPKNRGMLSVIGSRLRAFLIIVAGIGTLLLVSVGTLALTTTFSEWLNRIYPIPTFVIPTIAQLISLAVTALFFAMIFKLLPDAHVAWCEVWVGAIATAILFLIGKTLIVLYIAHAALASTYGAAASLVIILLWVYYSSQILLLGGEFTRAYAELFHPCGSAMARAQMNCASPK